jgi:hypothetical protein
MAAWLLVAALGGCGDDSASNKQGKDASTSDTTDDSKGSGGKTGGTTKKDAGAGDTLVDAGGTDSGSIFMRNDAGYLTIDGGEVCGKNVCKPEECCQDQFSGTCGVEISDLMNYTNGQRACLLPPPPDSTSDKRCPGVNIMNIFTIPSCCTDMGQCGVDLSMFNYGCVENGEAKKGAEGMMGASGIMWPDPKPCD